jgi:hypothetical protein
MASETADETATATAYPNRDQYEEWKQHADELGMTISEYMEAMIEAGRKKFTPTTTPDESAEELREQRNDLREEMEHYRERVEHLETELYDGERGKILEYVEENPGATYHDILQEVQDTAGERVTRILDAMQGDDLDRDGDGYYRRDS